MGRGAGVGGVRRVDPTSSSCCRYQQIAQTNNKKTRPNCLQFCKCDLFFVFSPPTWWASPAPARPGAAGAGCGRGRERRGARRGARPPTRSPERRGRAPGRGAPAPRTGTALRTPRTPLQRRRRRRSEVRGQGITIRYTASVQ